MAVFSAVDAGISAYQAGYNVFQAVGASLAAAAAAYVGAQVGAGFGEWVGGGQFGASVFAGMFGGAAGGAVRSALTGQDVVAGTLIGGGVGTGMGIMVGGFTYTKPATPDTQSTPTSGDNPATNTAIKNGNPQGAIDNEVKTSNQAPVVSRQTAAEKIAIATEKGAVGTGNNPSSTPVADTSSTTKLTIFQSARRALAVAHAKMEILAWKILHAPVHFAATISEAYGPMESPLSLGLEYVTKSPVAAFAIEQALSPVDEFMEEAITEWEVYLQYWVNYGR